MRQWDGSKLATIDSSRGTPTKGDGTVPGFALAQPVGLETPTSIMHCNQLHGTIQNYEGSINQIVGTLKTGEPSSKRSGKFVSMRCDDVVRAGEDCRIQLEFQAVPTPGPS